MGEGVGTASLGCIILLDFPGGVNDGAVAPVALDISTGEGRID